MPSIARVTTASLRLSLSLSSLTLCYIDSLWCRGGREREGERERMREKGCCLTDRKDLLSLFDCLGCSLLYHLSSEFCEEVSTIFYRSMLSLSLPTHFSLPPSLSSRQKILLSQLVQCVFLVWVCGKMVNSFNSSLKEMNLSSSLSPIQFLFFLL